MPDTDRVGTRWHCGQIIKAAHHRFAVVHRPEYLHEQLVLTGIDAADDHTVMPIGQRLKMRDTYRGHPKAKRQPARGRHGDADASEIPRPDADADRGQVAIRHSSAGQNLGAEAKQTFALTLVHGFLNAGDNLVA
jgi:hypothetical protein